MATAIQNGELSLDDSQHYVDAVDAMNKRELHLRVIRDIRNPI